MKNLTQKLWFLNPLYLPAWIIVSILWLITRLPIRLQMQVGKLLGRFLHLFPTQLKKITRINIELCFPEMPPQQQSLLIKKNFESLGLGLIESAMSWWLPNKKLELLFKINGLEHAEAAFAKGKGIILVSPHFTCLEMVGRLLGMHYTFAVMYRPHKKRIISYIHERFRGKHYVHYIARHRLREVLRTLEKNMAVWYAYDIDAGKKHGVFAPFFNVPASTLTTVSRLAELSGAAVMPIYFHRNDETLHYEITLGEPLKEFPTTSVYEDAKWLNQLLETGIRTKPDQYVWQYKRFKTRPEGEVRLY